MSMVLPGVTLMTVSIGADFDALWAALLRGLHPDGASGRAM